MFAPDWISHHTKAQAMNMACMDVHSGRTFTYGQLDSRIAAVASALISEFRLAPNNRIAVLSRNDSDVLEIQFACQRAGVIFVPLNWRLATRELELIACDAAPSVLFYGTEFGGAAEQLVCTSGIPYAVEMRCGKPSEYERIARGLATTNGIAHHSADDICALLYTSGTTGVPKGVQITYGMRLCNAIVLGMAFRLSAESRNLVVLPMFHTGGLNVFANPIFFYGGANIILREFDPALVVEILRAPRYGITHFLGVPTIHAQLAAEAGFGDGWTVKPYGVCVAGAPCPPSVIQVYNECGLMLRQCWGMTEAGPLALIMPDAPPPGKSASSGLPSIFAEIAIADATGQPVASGETGELLIRGPVVTSGYWKRPEATREVFRDTWLRTGDAAYRDADGHHYIVDRWKDMYISGGENVYPAEIERVLSLVSGVAECAVVGVPHVTWGEVGKAFIVCKSESAISETLLVAHCEQHLARYKIPKQFAFVNELPRNAAGKILKAKLREMAPSTA